MAEFKTLFVMFSFRQGIAKSFARILLVHYAWDEDKLLGHFFERGIEYVYKSAGVVPDKDEREEQESDDTEVQRAVKHQKKEVPCERYRHPCRCHLSDLTRMLTRQLHG